MRYCWEMKKRGRSLEMFFEREKENIIDCYVSPVGSLSSP